MKFKTTLFGAAAFSLAALGIRIAEYFITIDAEGYYLQTSAASILSTVLTVLLAAGSALCLFAPLGTYKEQVNLGTLFGQAWMPRILFALMGILSVADGVLRYFSTIEIWGCIVIGCWLVGAFGWLWLCRSPKRAGLVSLLIVLQLGAQIVSYFWSTYKYIQISAYVLGMLGWCLVLFFAFSLAKTLTGAACTKGRLAASGGLVVLLLPAAFLAPLAGSATAADLLLAMEGVVLTLLAGYTLYTLTKEIPEEAEEFQVEAPDLSELDTFLETVPDPEETAE